MVDTPAACLANMETLVGHKIFNDDEAPWSSPMPEYGGGEVPCDHGRQMNWTLCRVFECLRDISKNKRQTNKWGRYRIQPPTAHADGWQRHGCTFEGSQANWPGGDRNPKVPKAGAYGEGRRGEEGWLGRAPEGKLSRPPFKPNPTRRALIILRLQTCPPPSSNHCKGRPLTRKVVARHAPAAGQ